MLETYYVLMLLASFNVNNVHSRTMSFEEAKPHLKEYYKSGKEFYCGCDYTGNKVSHTECGYSSSKYTVRSKKIEMEHIVPAENFGRAFKEWREGHPKCGKDKGRKCAKMVNKDFRAMEGDLHNLVPAMGSLNAVRSNWQYAMVNYNKKEFGACEFKVDKEFKTIEPRKEIRGDIARVYFYMEKQYSSFFKISDKQRKLLEVWNKEDPVSEEERKKNEWVKQKQGNSNPFIN